MPRRADEIAVRQALNECWAWGRDQAAADTYQMVFDQGESFRGYLTQLKQNKRARSENTFLDKTSGVDGDMRRVPSLQLADLLAWTSNNKHAVDVPHWYRKVKNLHASMLHIDASVMHTGEPDVEAYWRSLKLPNRKEHR